MGALIAAAGFVAFIGVQYVLVMIASARREGVSPLSREFWF